MYKSTPPTVGVLLLDVGEREVYIKLFDPSGWDSEATTRMFFGRGWRELNQWLERVGWAVT